ncbi:MAG: hypothetical protein QOH59_2609 [Gemmatimonadales bacterium]|jgi:hypothetical protein|nr:hypothetical protein [Gemmatimonadales bacterium]
MSRCRAFVLTIAAVLLTGTACSDSTTPGDGTRPPDDLNFARLASTSPPLFNPEQSFYAVKGEDREIRISFQNLAGGEGEEFLRLRVRNASLLSRPDGTPFAEGDSVLITVRVDDVANIVFQAEPSGLTFNPAEPAELKIHYNHADHDFNEDGAVNAFDDQIKTQLAIWRQETLSDPFIRLGSVNVEGLEEINADILGFTRFAIAY